MTGRAPIATVLLVEDDGMQLGVVKRWLDREGHFTVHTARDGNEGLRVAREVLPDLVLSDYEMPGLDGFQLCKELKADPATARAMFIILTGHTHLATKVAGLDQGVDDYLTKPVEPLELVTKMRAMLRIKGLHDQAIADKAALHDMHLALSGSFDQLLGVLVHLMDLRLPGAAARGVRLAAMANRLADVFPVPAELRRDLDVAAQLQEIGRVIALTGASRDDGVDTSWQYLAASRDVIAQVDRFAEAADLVGAIGEHWDGTGRPGQLLRGQIPLRSRILRVLVDYFAALDLPGAAADPQAVLALLERRAGTWYDPAVVALLRSTLSRDGFTGSRMRCRHVDVASIEPGMVLAADIVTSSGVKLLAQGAEMTEETVALIRKRHQSDPVLGGVAVGALQLV